MSQSIDAICEEIFIRASNNLEIVRHEKALKVLFDALNKEMAQRGVGESEFFRVTVKVFEKPVITYRPRTLRERKPNPKKCKSEIRKFQEIEIRFPHDPYSPGDLREKRSCEQIRNLGTAGDNTYLAGLLTDAVKRWKLWIANDFKRPNAVAESPRAVDPAAPAVSGYLGIAIGVTGLTYNETYRNFGGATVALKIVECLWKAGSEGKTIDEVYKQVYGRDEVDIQENTLKRHMRGAKKLLNEIRLSIDVNDDQKDRPKKWTLVQTDRPK